MAPDDLIARLQDYVQFLQDLQNESTELLSHPIAEGKWSIHDIVSHIMMWDRDFLQKTVQPLEAGESPPITEDADVQAFNAHAVAYGRNLDREELLAQAVSARAALTAGLARLSPETFDAKPRGGEGSSLAIFLRQMFVEHDRHHVDQMRAYLESRRA